MTSNLVNTKRNKMASRADEKFGLPTVRMTELYGLFQSIKSFPLYCKNAYIARIDERIIAIFRNLFTKFNDAYLILAIKITISDR